MSGVINKVKNALSSDNTTTGTTHTAAGTHATGTHTTGTHAHGTHTHGTAEGVAGPHSSRVANAADPRVDSDLDGSRHVGTGGTAGAGAYGSNSAYTGTTGSGLTGTHGTTHTGTTGLGSTHNTHGTTHNTTAGPHSSNLANKADPRVDSDLDGSRNLGAATGTTHNTHGTTHHTHGTTHTGTTGGLTGTTHGTTHNTTAGPHSSNLANKADPRVDSDLDGSRNLGAATGTTHNTYGTTHNTHGTTHNTHGTTGLGTSHNTSTTAPHNSSVLNKVDPRVDSTTAGAYDGTHAGNTTHTGTHTTTAHTGTHGGISHSTNAGPHNSNLANKADPRVDSDLDGKGNRHGATTGTAAGVLGAHGSHATPGSGTAQNTAGPHNSDLLNKLDPRVDSDLDGSKTFGGNKTHA